jgi:hypothetical protein
MAPLRTLLQALASGQLDVVERTADELRALDGQVEDDDRRHAQEDAERSERTRQARERAAAVLDPDDPERPEPEWDATQPHVPFPMLGATQAISMTSLLDEPEAPDDWTAGDAEAPTTSPETADAAPGDAVAADDMPAVPDGTAEPDRSPWHDETVEESQPVPLTAADADASTFEIDEVEALPEDADGVLDLHEGASDFVPVEHRPEHPAHDARS